MHIIAYPGGCYGQFTGWTLEWIQGKYPANHRPFTKKNNSHNWNGNFRSSVDQAVLIPKERSHVHPIQHKTDNVISNIKKLLTAYDKVILLYPALDDFLWSCNNKLTKIHGSADAWKVWNKSYVQDDLSNWESTDDWEYREFLSLWLYNQHMNETGYKDITNYENSKVFKIQISQLRDDFINTITDLSKWLQIENVRSDDDLTKLHLDWLQNEPYLYKDRLIKEMVDAIINNVDIPMNECSIFDQADIQRRLRNAGYEIKCYGLNEWPSTTTQLRELIYEAE